MTLYNTRCPKKGMRNSWGKETFQSLFHDFFLSEMTFHFLDKGVALKLISIPERGDLKFQKVFLRQKVPLIPNYDILNCILDHNIIIRTKSTSSFLL